MRGPLILAGATLLAGCPLPCPRGTTTDGGDQCMSLVVPGPQELRLVNETRDELALSVRVSPRAVYCGRISADEASAVLATVFFAGDGGSAPERYARATRTGALASHGAWEFRTGQRCLALRVWIGDEHEGHDLIARTDARLAIVPGPTPGTFAIHGADEVQRAAPPRGCASTMQGERMVLSALMTATKQAFWLGEPTGPACLLGDALVVPTPLRRWSSAGEATDVAPGTTVHPYTLFNGVRALVLPSAEAPADTGQVDDSTGFDAALVAPATSRVTARTDRAAPSESP